jgi:hypothetical protein
MKPCPVMEGARLIESSHRNLQGYRRMVTVFELIFLMYGHGGESPIPYANKYQAVPVFLPS